MYKLFLIIFFTTTKIYSDCGDYGFKIFPNGNTITNNTSFIIESFQENQFLTYHKNANLLSFYLVSESDSVKLIGKEYIDIGRDINQVLFMCEKKLKINNKYNIIVIPIEPISKNLQMLIIKFNNFYKEKYWTVYKSIDKIKPIWLSKPKVTNKIYNSFGCGEISIVNYKYYLWELSDYVFKIYIKDLRSNETLCYYDFPKDDNILGVGSNMCFGRYLFEKRSKYFKIWFDVIDMNGNVNKWKGSPRNFEKPNKQKNLYIPNPPKDSGTIRFR